LKRLSQERSYFVVKDNDLITKSRYSLTLQQQKILLYFISRIKPDDDEYTTYELTIKDFAKVCGYVEDSGFYYQTIKADIKKLADNSNWIEVDKGHEVLFRWIDRAEIDSNSGTIKIAFHYTVSRYLFDLRERYTQYSLYNILCLSHKYSIRLYELLNSMKYKERFEISIDELRKRLDAESYTRFNNFNQRILKPCIDEINDYTDLAVEYSYKKNGKTITHIIFEFNEKTIGSSVITRRLQEEKLEPDKRKQQRRREKIRKEEAIEGDAEITSQLSFDDFSGGYNDE